MTPVASRCSLVALPLAGLLFLAGPVLAKGEGFEELLQTVFQSHCVKCHGKEGKVKGKVNLLELKDHAALKKDPELLETILDVIDFQEMPPEDEPQVDEARRKAIVEYLRKELHAVVSEKKSYPRTPIRRMNRFQYANAVEDLFELKVVVFPLPEKMARDHSNYFKPAEGKMPDNLKVGSRPLGKSQLIEKRLAGVAPFPQDLRAEHGFDNRGDHLSLSPLLMESFLALSRSIVESRDFNEKNCGIWNDFFAPPAGDLREAVELRLRKFLTRAFRKPVEEEVLARYTGHVTNLLGADVPFADAMKEAASAAIASPRFLYLYDSGTKGEGIQPLDDYDLASRLAFFLWGSIPDVDLLIAAKAGDLKDPEKLAAEVDRMLKDDRLKRFCDSFPAQWLQLDRIISSTPDPDHFPAFYINNRKFRVSMDMMLEPLLLFETILVEDRSILDLIHSDFTYRSDRLQEWYDAEFKGGRGGPTVLNFQRVPVTSEREGGVITTAATMTMTSGTEESKPITRGAWMASVIFNDPPEPPPADVPPLEEGEGEDLELTLRERFAEHREREDCAGCHAQIDPLGFALENYDAVGRWREEYPNGHDVDVSGVLFRKHSFGTVEEFKAALFAEKDRFARAFAGHLLSFALGRELAAADAPVLDKMVEKAKTSDYNLQSMIHAVVQSEPFLTKVNPGEKALTMQRNSDSNSQ